MKELESKFVLHDRAPKKALRRLLQELVWAGFRAHPQGTRPVHDVYFDTPDARIQAAGWSLRARDQGGWQKLTMKRIDTGVGGFFERQELEQPAPAGELRVDLLDEGPVRDLLKRYVPESESLEPVFDHVNVRTLYRLSHPDHPRSEIELAMDRVRVNGEHVMRYVEFEGELKQGSPEILESFVDVMRVQPRVVASCNSKFQRGLFNRDFELAIGDRRRDLMTPSDHWAELGTHYLAEQLEALTAYLPYAHEGLHIEGVHQMRVATRRMRAALKAFGPVLPEEATRRLVGEASWLCDMLGEVRDLDVHLEHVDEYRQQLPTQRRETLNAYENHLKKAHRRARACLITALDSRRCAAFLADTRALIAEAEALAATHSATIEEFARGYVPRRLKTIRREGRKINDKSPDEELHRLRIRIKKLRYQLEILTGPYGEALSRASGDLKRLQSRLGDHQDACVARTELAEYRDTFATGSRERRTFDWLIKLETSRAAALRNRFGRDWKRFERGATKLKRLLEKPARA
jgi:CHAD domain-containing protein